jgi:RpiR family transcriptional regulator, carbohydrate utilization regulator
MPGARLSWAAQLQPALVAETLSPHRVIHEAVRPTDDTLATLDSTDLERAAQALDMAARIELYANDSSVPIALEAYSPLIWSGLPVTIVDDPHLRATSAEQLPANSVAFAISHTGHTCGLHYPLQRARQACATTILPSSYHNSPIDELADTVLVTASLTAPQPRQPSLPQQVGLSL